MKLREATATEADLPREAQVVSVTPRNKMPVLAYTPRDNLSDRIRQVSASVETMSNAPNLPQPVLTDELGKLVLETRQLFCCANSFEDFISQVRGPSDLHEQVHLLDHPAAELLGLYRDRGVDFRTGAQDWDQDHVSRVIERGAHRSATEHLAFVRQEFVDFIQKRYWIVLPASDVMNLPGLRLSPLGVVPQAERRPRLICDYTFHGVNQETTSDAPPEAMQFGKALSRILWALAYANPSFGPVALAKFDLSDGFYRIQLALRAIAALGVILPQAPEETPLVALPMVLPMGWTESPPAFCAATETVADLANAKLASNEPQVAHRLETIAKTPPQDWEPPSNTEVQGPSTPRLLLQQPLRLADVYVDDLVGAAQGGDTANLYLTRVILHSLDQVFRALSPQDLPARQEPASLSKLEKGDGFMCFLKTVLGWLIDTIAMTLRLTARRYARLQEILAELPRSRKRVSVQTWQKVLGELCSMAIAIPGSRGLFSALQFRFAKDKTRIRLTHAVHDVLDDFRWLTSELHSRPTRIYELFPGFTNVIGATDASGLGMGGVFFVPTPESTPDCPMYDSYVWQVPYDDAIRAKLVTYENPQGTISNSDLELMATVAQHDVIAHTAQVAEATLSTLHDNTPTVFWNRKGSTTTEGPAAYLLRLQALHARQYRYVPLHDFIPGHLNRMADEASRRTSYNQTELLTLFNSQFPQPKQWRACTLRSEMNSALILALHRKRCEPTSWQNESVLPKLIGDCGWSSVPRSTWILGSARDTILYRTSKFSRCGTAMDASHPAENPFDLAQLATPYEISARRSNGWGPEIHASTISATLTTD